MNIESFINNGRVNKNGRIELPKKARIREVNGIQKSKHEKMASAHGLCPLMVVDHDESDSDIVYLYCIPKEGFITIHGSVKCYELWKTCPLLSEELRNGRAKLT